METLQKKKKIGVTSHQDFRDFWNNGIPYQVSKIGKLRIRINLYI